MKRSRRRLLRDLPHWYLEGGWIRRKYRTIAGRNVDGDQCRRPSGRKRPGIIRTLPRPMLGLKFVSRTTPPKALRNKDFELAKKIEDVVHWRPGKEDGALEARRSGPALRLRQIRLLSVAPQLLWAM